MLLSLHSLEGQWNGSGVGWRGDKTLFKMWGQEFARKSCCNLTSLSLSRHPCNGDLIFASKHTVLTWPQADAVCSSSLKNVYEDVHKKHQKKHRADDQEDDRKTGREVEDDDEKFELKLNSAGRIEAICCESCLSYPPPPIIWQA